MQVFLHCIGTCWFPYSGSLWEYFCFVVELIKGTKKMAEVEECDVPVVAEEFLEDASKGAALTKIAQHTISSWGAPRLSLPLPQASSSKPPKKSQFEIGVYSINTKSVYSCI